MAIERTPFLQVVDEIVALHHKKQADYGKSHDPFANVRASEDFGIPGWVGCMTRANDKMKRLQKAAKGGTMSNESVEDSLLDLAVYAIIGLVLYRENKETVNNPIADYLQSPTLKISTNPVKK
jgi:hypothetical protein